MTNKLLENEAILIDNLINGRPPSPVSTRSGLILSNLAYRICMYKYKVIYCRFVCFTSHSSSISEWRIEHQSGKPQKSGSAGCWGIAPLDAGVVGPLETRHYPTCVIILNNDRSRSNSVGIIKRLPKMWVRWSPAPWDRGFPDPLKSF